jgi:hypothetical protein
LFHHELLSFGHVSELTLNGCPPCPDSCPRVLDEDIAGRNFCVFFSIPHFGGK